MVKVAFAHGLLGDKSFPYKPEEFTQGTLHAVREAANAEGAEFISPPYQTHQDKFPLVSKMGQEFDRTLLWDDIHTRHPATLWIGSSVGAAVMLQALTQRSQLVKDMILFKPVYDVIAAIVQQAKAAGAEAMLDQLMENKDAFLPIPVASTDVGGDQGVFKVRGQHLESLRTLRLLTDPQNTVAHLIKTTHQEAEGHKIGNMKIIVAESDPLSPPSLAQTFKSIIQPLVKNEVTIDVIPGDHGTDHSAYLGGVVRTAIQSGWGSLAPMPA